MKRNIILFLALSFASIVSTRMPDQIKPARHFDAEKLCEINEPVRFVNLTEEQIDQIKIQYPELNIKDVRYAAIDTDGNITPYKYTIDKTTKKATIDWLELAIKSNQNTSSSVVSHIISPTFYYSNNFEYVKKEQLKKIHTDKYAIIIFGAFIGYCTSYFGTLIADKIASAIKKPIYANFRDRYFNFSHDTMYGIIPGTVTFTALFYRMFYVELVEFYNQITESEYLEIRMLYPEIDCEDFFVTHPIKSQFLRLMKFCGLSFFLAGGAFALKNYVSSAFASNNC